MSGYHLGVYQVGECVVDLHENGDAYSGTIYADPTIDPADRVLWRFDDLRGPAIGAHDERMLALSACSFGGYYSTFSRGDEVPDWAPEPEVADAISDASACALAVEELDELPPWCVALDLVHRIAQLASAAAAPSPDWIVDRVERTEHDARALRVIGRNLSDDGRPFRWTLHAACLLNPRYALRTAEFASDALRIVADAVDAFADDCTAEVAS